MRIDQDKEKLVSLYGLKKLVPTRPCANTVKNWARVGKLSKATGKIVFLESIQIGGHTFTSVEAYRRFVNQLNGYE